MSFGTVGSSATGTVVKKVSALTCTLQINTHTYTSSPTSTTNWFTIAKTLDIDGGSSSKFSAYETYIMQGQYPSQQQATADIPQSTFYSVTTISP